MANCIIKVMIIMIKIYKHKHLHTSHTVICPQIAQRDCTRHALHTHIRIHARIVPKLASRRGRCWSECHGWVSPKKIGTPHYNTGGLCCFYPLPRAWTGWASMQPRDTWLWVGSERTDISSWKSPRRELFHTIIPVVSAASGRHPPHPELRAPGWGTLSPLPPSSPPETSSLSHADEPRDHPRSITVHSHTVKGPHTHTDSGLCTHSLSWCVKRHKSRHAQPMSLSGELIFMAMKGEGRDDWEIVD